MSTPTASISRSLWWTTRRPRAAWTRCKEEFPDVVLIKSADNLGFAGANNVGFKESRGRNVLFLNPDMKLLNPAINIMYDSLQTLPDAGIVGCKMYRETWKCRPTAS